MNRILLAAGMMVLASQASAADSTPLSAKIDHDVEAAWKVNGVTPAPLADDAEFLRRIYLDLAGRIPAVSEVRDFLADNRSDKRSRLIDKLLEGPGFVQHFGTLWRREWLPQTLSDPQLQFVGVQFEPWIRERLHKNTPYDKIVREMLTVPPSGGPGSQPFNATMYASTAFLQVNAFKPENVAAAASRLFLGVKLECAQCHDHPFETYSRQQFWEFAAFFAGLQPINPRVGRVPAEAIEIRSLTIPGLEKKVSAKFLDGKEPKFQDKVSSRVTLTDWMTAKENPYFARNAVNRMWANFFGVGIIDPLDEPSKNPPSHPELLDAMAKSFAVNAYDIKHLIRAIVNSRTYQRSSASSSPSSNSGERTFARMPVRGLTPEQLFDSLVLATGYRGEVPVTQRQFVSPNSPRGEFLAKFASVERLSEVQTSILQALTLMNGKFIGELTGLDQARSELLVGVIASPFFDTRQKIETLYLATVSRFPRENELQKLTAYVEKGGVSGDANKALTDVFWALLNSSEFAFNH